MKTRTKENIIKYINRLKTNKVFTAKVFLSIGVSHDASRMALERMVSEGKLRKLANGRYYKPEQSIFGEISPSVEQVIADLLVSSTHQPIGYVTGTMVFASLGLTTQISSQVQIGVRKYRRPITRGDYRISFVLQPNSITRENMYLLQLLDVLRFVREIPGSTPDEIVSRMSFLIGELSLERQRRMVWLALRYTQYVRALLGAILENLGASDDLINLLKASLNSLTHYKLSISQDKLPTSPNWNIR